MLGKFINCVVLIPRYLRSITLDPLSTIFSNIFQNAWIIARHIRILDIKLIKGYTACIIEIEYNNLIRMLSD